MESFRCPLDVKFASQIASILATPSPASAKAYYDDVISTRQCHGIEIKHGGKFGKGVYACKEYKEEELVLMDRILVGSQHSTNKIDCLVCSYCFRYIGSIELQIGRKLYLNGLGLSSDCDMGEEACPVGSGKIEDNHCGASKRTKTSDINEEIMASLMNGKLSLPYSKNFSLPPVVSCPGGCEEEHYCSEGCAMADWASFHSLLCTGEKCESSRREALVKFMEHAHRTNDIFILAAKVISCTILKYKNIKKVITEGQTKRARLIEKGNPSFSLLLEAWKPFSMGYKKRWWDCIALPDSVDCKDENAFRMQIRDLAFTSLQLLKDAIFDEECAVLFSLEIYGHIIGMFELNNLDLVVASPVEDYFIFIDDLPSSKKEEVENLTRRFLDALGDDYSLCCQGTAFFPLQSCINHSCNPNAKAFKRDEDRDGSAIILASRPIRVGEEITISYIDEDLAYEERQALLADYGFTCRCTKCQKEQPKLLKKTSGSKSRNRRS